jgi:hypothetical protein
MSNVTSLAKWKHPLRTVVLTCCHGKAQDFPLSFKKKGIPVTPDDWKLLAKAADWISFTKNPQTVLAGRVAMRVLDCLRARFFENESMKAYVRELIDSKISPKNHGIVLESV